MAGFKGHLSIQGHPGPTPCQLCSTRHNILDAFLIQKHRNGALYSVIYTHNLQFFRFFENLAILIFCTNCNFHDELVIRLCRPIQSVTILVINKSDTRCIVVRFWFHLYDYRQN